MISDNFIIALLSLFVNEIFSLLKLKEVRLMTFQQARQRVGLSQRQVAEILGINQSTVCLWEQGKTAPRAAILPRVAQLYRCSIDDLLKERS